MHEILGYALYDKKALVYDTPMFFLNEVSAKRWFYTLCQKGEGRFDMFKDDMELHSICSFHVVSGTVKYDKPRIVLEGKQIGKETANNEISNEAQI